MKFTLVSAGRYQSNYGGGQVYVRHLAQELCTAGHQVSVITFQEDIRLGESQRLNLDGIDLWQCSTKTSAADVQHPLELQGAILSSMRRALKQIQPNLVHAHGWKATAVTVCKEMGIPCVITAHHGGIVCPNGTLMNQADAICEKPVSAKNCLDCCLHNVPGGKFWSPIINQLPQEYAGRIASFLRSRRNIPFVTPAFTTSLAIANKIKIIAAMGHGADAFIAPSAAIAKTLERNGIESKKIFVIPHGIPLAAQQPFQPGLGSRPVRFIYVGRISHIKGLHVMLTALSQLNPADYELHVVGGAVTKPEKRYLAKLHRAFPQVKTTWHGVCDPNKVQELVTYCDVMIHPAICLEIFGLTIAEAMALGRPVLATRCGGAEAQIKDGVDGWLVPPNDIRALSNAIRKLIQNPESVVETAANIGQVVSITTHVEALEALYKTVLSHSKARNPS